MLDPSENSYQLSQLTPDTTYILRMRMLHNQGLADLNTVDVSFHTNLAPNIPQTPQLSTPLTSPGMEERPVFTIAGVKKDDLVRIYKDDLCSIVAGEEVSPGSSVLIQVDDALAEGTYLFTANAINSLGHASNCSGAVEYQRELPPYYPMIESSSDSLLGSSGMIQVVNGSADDSNFQITLPFDFYLAGATYTNWYVVSNTYITAGTPSSNYSGLNAGNPAIPKILLGAADNSYQQAFTQTGANYFRVRYEGTASTGGTVGAPNIVYELTFFKPTDTEQLIQVTFGTHARNTGAFGIASATTYYQSAPAITADSSYVLLGNLDGTSWVIHANSKVTGYGINE